MLRTPHSVRHHLTVYQRGDATGDAVASLFRAAAERIESLGPVIVRHTALETTEDPRSSEVSLTVYFDDDPTVEPRTG